MSEEIIDNNEAVEKALAIVEAIPDEELQQPDSDKQNSTEARPPREASPSDKDGHSEPADQEQPEKVTAPKSWRADAKEIFEQLPPDLQEKVLERDSEMQSAFNRVVNEARTSKSAADAEKEKAAEYAKRYNDQILQVAQAMQFYDPKVAEYNNIDWDKLNRENPAQYVTKRHEMEKHLQLLAHVDREKQRIQVDEFNNHRQREVESLYAKMPEMADNAKAVPIRVKMENTLVKEYGFTPEELRSVNDHRTFMMMVAAAKYHELVNAKNTVALHKSAQPTRVVQNRAVRDHAEEGSERFRALKSKALKSGKQDDAVNAILAAIGEK